MRWLTLKCEQIRRFFPSLLLVRTTNFHLVKENNRNVHKMYLLTLVHEAECLEVEKLLRNGHKQQLNG